MFLVTGYRYGQAGSAFYGCRISQRWREFVPSPRRCCWGLMVILVAVGVIWLPGLALGLHAAPDDDGLTGTPHPGIR